MSQARYINPYTDFGFKKLFGEEGYAVQEIAELTGLSAEEIEKL